MEIELLGPQRTGRNVGVDAPNSDCDDLNDGPFIKARSLAPEH